MTVRLTKIFETSTTGKMPTGAPVVWSEGINAEAGPVEFLTLKYDLTFAATPVAAADVTSLIDNFRVVLNGSVVHSFQAGFSALGSDQASQYQYFLNSIGGRAYEVPDSGAAATRTGFIDIPLGQMTTGQVQRYEIIVGWSTAAAAIVSGNMSYWLQYNTGMVKTTVCVPSTSFTHTANSIAQVIVQIPENLPGVVSGVCILNEAASDNFGAQGIRINALSDYGLTVEHWRSQGGELSNGVLFNAGSVAIAGQPDRQAISCGAAGALFIPTYGLTNVKGGLALSVDTGAAACTRQYIPVITNPVGKAGIPSPTQTQTAVGNTADAMLRGNLN